MNTDSVFHTQQNTGDRFLADGWHARSIATSDRPGSRWILLDPTRRIELALSRGLAGPHLQLSAIRPPGEPGHGPLWRVIALRIPPSVTIRTAHLAALRTTRAPDSPTAARRAMAKELRDHGWRCDRGWLTQATAATVTWTSPDTGTSAVWTAPSLRGIGGWQITGERLLATAHPYTPTELLRLMATA